MNRNLERLRGFDMFMRALPMIQKAHPQVRVLIVGDNEPGYAGSTTGGRPLRQVMLEELSGQLDLDRIHFLGRIPHAQLMALFQASWVHVYLSYPFVLSWSMLEAMESGAFIVGSRTPPVEEVIEDGVNGWLVDFFDADAMANKVAEALAKRTQVDDLRAKARETVMVRYDLKDCLKQQLALIDRAVAENNSD